MEKGANLSSFFPSFAPPGRVQWWHPGRKPARKPFLNAILLALVFGLCFAWGTSVRADIRLRGVMLRFGGTPRLTASDWATMNYVLENSADTRAEVLLSLQASSRNRAVFEKVVTIGPRARLSGRELITAAASENYVLSLFVDGRRTLRTDVPTRFVDPHQHCEFTVLNDDGEYTGLSGRMGKFSLRHAVQTTTLNARRAPTHWAGYGHTRVLLVANPDYRSLTAAQYTAILEFVQRGGTLLFAHPGGALRAAETPLRELLPVVPLRVRLIEELPPLDRWGEQWWAANPRGKSGKRSPLRDPDGIEFLESCPRGAGVTTLSLGEFPLIRWARRGLGVVGMIAIDPTQDVVRGTGVTVPLWNHVLVWSQAPFSLRNYANSQVLPDVMSRLTGFRIMSVKKVGGILLFHVLMLSVVLLGGTALRRHVTAWLLAALSGVVMTVILFLTAFHQNATRAARSATIVDLRMVSGKRTTGQAIFSLFSKSDQRPTVTDTLPDGLFRALPSAARGKRREPLEPPLIVHRERGRVTLRNLHVKALKPRSFVALHTDPPVKSVAPVELTFGSGVPRLRGEIPAELSTAGTRVLLLGGHTVQEVRRDSSGLTLVRDGGSWMRTDPFLGVFSSYLLQGEFPCPSLVLLRPWAGSGRSLAAAPGGYERRGYSVEFLPVATEVKAGEVRIPSEFLFLRPSGSAARMVFDGRDWRSSVLRGRELVLLLEVDLPPVCSQVRVGKISAVVDVSNAGGNVLVDCRVAPLPLRLYDVADQEAPRRLWGEAIPGVASGRGNFQFADLASREVVQPVYAGFYLVLRLSQKAVVSTLAEAERSNRWRVNRLRVDVTGSVEDGADRKRRF